MLYTDSIQQMRMAGERLMRILGTSTSLSISFNSVFNKNIKNLPVNFNNIDYERQ